MLKHCHGIFAYSVEGKSVRHEQSVIFLSSLAYGSARKSSWSDIAHDE